MSTAQQANQINPPLRVAAIEGGSGAGGSAYSLQRLAEVIRRDFSDRVELVCFGHGEAGVKLFADAGLQYKVIKSLYFPGRFVEMRRLLRKEKIDLLHCNNSPYGLAPYMAAAKSMGLPITLHLRGLKTVTRMERFLYRWVRHVVTVMREGVGHIVNSTNLTESQVTFLGDGVDLGLYKADENIRGKIRKNLELADSDFAVLLPATLQPGKGQTIAIEAAEELIKKHENFVFLFAGGEHYQFEGFAAELENLVKSKGLAKNVRLLGHRTDMPDLLKSCDLVILPSVLTEGMPCIIMEAFASQRAVVASRIGGIPEAVDEHTGALFEPGNANELAQKMLAMFDNVASRKEKETAAYKMAENEFDIKRKAEVITEIFKQAAAKG